MERVTRRKCISLAGVPVLAGLAAYTTREDGLLHAGGRPRFEPAGPEAARTRIQQRHLPNLPLVAHDGKRVRFYDDLVKDKKVVLTFVSTRDLPESRKVTENLATLQQFFGERVGSDMFLYSITRTPEEDTPSVLRNWAARSGAGPGWKFLTGEPAVVERLRQSLGFASPDAAEDAKPSYSIGQLRHGVETEMRWGHCQSQASPRVIAHALLLDFGAGPLYPNSGFPWKLNRTAAPGPPPIWDCQRLLAELP